MSLLLSVFPGLARDPAFLPSRTPQGSGTPGRARGDDGL
jgi:hypothetical protein